MPLANVIYPFSTTWQDYPDCDSLAIAIYIMGCENNCLNCHNSQFQNSLYNKSKTFEVIDFINLLSLDLIKNKTNKVVFLGGDPLFDNNFIFTKEFTDRTWKTIDTCIYTGYSKYTWPDKGLNKFKFMKCGEYIESQKQQAKKTDKYIQFASKNQKLYDSEYNLLSVDGRYYF